MSLITIQKLQRNGWPTDEPVEQIEESLLKFESGGHENEDEIVKWKEWRLDGKIVKRGAHVHLKKNIFAEAMAAEFK